MFGQHCSKGYSLGCYLSTHQNKSEPFIPELAGGARGFFLPRHLVIWKSWSMSESPGKRGSPVSISVIREPIAHTSTGLGEKNHHQPSSAQLHCSQGWARRWSTPSMVPFPGWKARPTCHICCPPPAALGLGTSAWPRTLCKPPRSPPRAVQTRSRRVSQSLTGKPGCFLA